MHIVQANETLYSIALQYGTTVDAIAAANGIADVRYISIGQQLIIPGSEATTGPVALAPVPTSVIPYIVQPGDSVESLARQYGVTPTMLAAANNMFLPVPFYVGQEIVVPQGNPTAVPQAVYAVRAGDTLGRVALRYNVAAGALAQLNDLSPSSPVFVGQRLWIPGGNRATRVYDLPYPVIACQLTPVPSIQGQTLSIHLQTATPATMTGMFMGYPLQVMTQDATQHYAMFGIHTFAESGTYPMLLTVTSAGDVRTSFELRIRIDDGDYGAEGISLATEMQDLLQPVVIEPETDYVTMKMSGFTAQRYFSGVVSLPSDGAITSYFGTRRLYNGGVLDTYHSGVDFGGATGAPVLAPAAGVVVVAENLPVRGNATIIDHGWGVYTGYWHQNEIYVAVGDVVTGGQVIGTIGSTGRSTGPHLHWEMWVSGVPVDPLQWLQQPFP
ncbi:MAG: LysM peptidoglycan-binding domain-containing protein [Chloroflexi bacterium]|nr:LysM peptidoglycan-binding domain-containing protein [Chloroflexota bacterium]